jgi:translocator protein
MQKCANRVNEMTEGSPFSSLAPFVILQRPGPALVDIVVLVPAVLAALIAFLRVKRLAGALLVPYAMWVTFGAVLNYAIWRSNT